MLEAPPEESEKLSWAQVAQGVLTVYCAIPVARASREAINEQIGREVFLYIAVMLAPNTGAAAFMNLRNRNLAVSAYLQLFGIIAVFVGYIYQLRKIPEEVIHLAD